MNSMRPTEERKGTIPPSRARPVILFAQHEPHHPPLCHRECQSVRGPDGPVGPSLPPRSDPIPSNTDGINGEVAVLPVDYGLLCSYADWRSFRMQLHAAEQLYINAEYQDAAARLIWIRELALAAIDNLGGHFPGEHMPDLTLAQAKAFADRAGALLRKLQLGLDYYGRSMNFVPLLSTKFYSDIFASTLNYGKAIEAAYAAYVAAGADLKLIQANTAQAVINLQAAIQEIHNAIKAADEQIRNLDDTIEKLKNELDRIWVELLSAEDDYKRAVERQNAERGGCSFGQIITFAAALVAVVVSAGTVAGAAIGAAKLILDEHPKDAKGQEITGDFAKGKYYVDQLQPVAQDAQALLQRYNELKDQLKSSDPAAPPSLPDDELKVPVDRAAFDKQVEPYLALPEAQRYKQLMHKFLDVTQLRNNDIIQYNQLYALTAALGARARTLEAQIVLTQSELARADNPALDVFRGIFEDGLRSVKELLVYLLFQANRALDFLTATNQPLPINDSSMDLLQISTTALASRLVAAKESRSQDQHLIGYSLDVSELVSIRAMDEFRKTGVLTFSLHSDTPQVADFIADLALVRVMKVSFDVPELSRQGKNFTIRVFQQGDSRLVNLQGQTMQYSHLPFAGAIIFQNGVQRSEAQITDMSSEYVGVGLLGTWTIRLNKGSPPLDLMQANTIKMVFSASYLVRA